MNLSKKWLNDFLSLDVSDKEFADKMTISGSKVEGISIEGKGISNIVVGKIIDIQKHPDSDHLLICAVDTGASDLVKIVTGAQNLSLEDYIPVALDNAIVFGGKSIKKGNLRGVESEGMLCSLSELGLAKNDFPYAIEDGIFILGDDCDKSIGLNIQEAIGLNDVITEFEITSNRPDCLSVIGLAREAAATFGKKLHMNTPVKKKSSGNVNDYLSVEIHDNEKCYRYIGAVVENVRIDSSPRWMRERLRASGVRPINNIVDITNYVMLEYGQPMHAFDIRYIEGSKVKVRCAAQGETIVTLDGIERNLEQDMLVIADECKPVAIAGVMGGEFSGIMSDTKTIVFESACFNGASIRSTAKRLGMRTESSSRFEKELDPAGCISSIDRALELVGLLDAGDIVTGLVDCNKSVNRTRVLPFDWEWINRFIGINVSRDEQKRILESVGFVVQEDNVKVPSFRNDIEHLADLSEEIARFYGYENIPNYPLTGIANGTLTQRQQFEKFVNETLISSGLSEIQTYSFVSTKCFDKICLPVDSETRNCICISNPLGEDTGVMRSTPLPSMLEVISRNYKYRNTEAFLYEIATEYISRGKEELPEENQKIIIGMYGSEASYYKAKGIVENLLELTGIQNYTVEPKINDTAFHPGRCAQIMTNGNTLAIIGEIHPIVQQNYEVNTHIYAAEIDFELLYKEKEMKRAYKPLPKYPSVDRDLSFVCDRSIPVLTLRNIISQAAGDLLESITLFDIYEGEQISTGKKSVAFSICLRSLQRTLTDKDADEAMKNVVSSLNEHGITLRT